MKGGIQPVSKEEQAIRAIAGLEARVQELIQELREVLEGEQREVPEEKVKREPTDIEIRKFLNVYYDVRELPNMYLKDIPSEKDGKRNPARDTAIDQIDNLEVIFDPVIVEMKQYVTPEQAEHLKRNENEGGVNKKHIRLVNNLGRIRPVKHKWNIYES